MDTKVGIARAGLGVLLAGSAWAQVTQRVNVSASGAQADGWSYGPSVSADGRYAAFDSGAWNLVPGDTNGWGDVFVRDLRTGAIEIVSVAGDGTLGDMGAGRPSMSADGRFVAFESLATQIVPGDTNGQCDVFVRDRQSGTTELVSVSTSGSQGDGYSGYASISADGRYVAFWSMANNLVSGDTGWWDIFVRDRQSGTTERVSVDSNGAQANGDGTVGYNCSISADGRYVVWHSWASNLVSGDTNNMPDVFVRDRTAGTTALVSLTWAGTQANLACEWPSISADGRYVTFWSSANNLVSGDANGLPDIFLRDRIAGTTELVSVGRGGTQGNDMAHLESAISADGRYVAFGSQATNLVGGDTNGVVDVFVRDRFDGTTQRVSIGSSGIQGNGFSGMPALSADGRYVGFQSDATNLVGGDTNGKPDVFVRDRDATSFTSLCDPGVGGVQACPCSNPPSGPGRGCDNSSGSGGASLSASGISYLSMDSLSLATSGEKPTALSVVMQGTASPPSGIIYGQGLRCVGGALLRLYTKSASGGTITAPDFSAGDAPVSVRSAALGGVIQPGQSRWYLVYYRDPTVLGGCPASSTFNATQTGRVDWSL